MTRAEIINNSAYWIEIYRLLLYRTVVYKQDELNKRSFTKFCKQLNLNKEELRDFIINDHNNISLWDFIDTALKIGKVPKIEFVNIEDFA